MKPKKWEYLKDAPFKISEQCCYIMKKKPFKQFHKETGLFPYTGVMASDSRQRKVNYLKHGCNSFEGTIQSMPLGFWLEEDIWNYIEKYKLNYSSIYDKVFKDFGGEKNENNEVNNSNYTINVNPWFLTYNNTSSES